MIDSHGRLLKYDISVCGMRGKLECICTNVSPGKAIQLDNDNSFAIHVSAPQ